MGVSRTRAPLQARLSRRGALAALAGAGAAGLGLGVGLAGGMEEKAKRLSFRATERPVRLLGPGGPESRLWSFTDELCPVIRMRRGERLVAALENGLPEHTTIHWHGIRLDNAMDGVPYMTQKPVEPGEHFTYDFVAPDAGTFFFHPHCNEAGQVGHGLMGVLIVEGDEPEPRDAEVILAVKDWRLAPDGSFLPFTTDRGAAKAGTFGTVRTVNGAAKASERVPASADLRIRILNVDATRILQVGVEGGPAAIVAVDGNAIAPMPLDTWRMGPAQRLDIVARSPRAGGTLKVVDYNAAEPYVLAELAAEGDDRRKGDFTPRPLIASDIPVPDLASAATQSYVLGAAGDHGSVTPPPSGDESLDEALKRSICFGTRTFWSINRRSWPTDGHSRPPEPLAALKAGASYRFTLQNATPHPHPIHLHGHTFRVLSSSRREIAPYWADTVLLGAKERVDIAFVAREGDWMFHCHILEHLETGMMGYFRVA